MADIKSFFGGGGNYMQKTSKPDVSGGPTSFFGSAVSGGGGEVNLKPFVKANAHDAACEKMQTPKIYGKLTTRIFGLLQKYNCESKPNNKYTIGLNAIEVIDELPVSATVTFSKKSGKTAILKINCAKVMNEQGYIPVFEKVVANQQSCNEFSIEFVDSVLHAIRDTIKGLKFNRHSSKMEDVDDWQQESIAFFGEEFIKGNECSVCLTKTHSRSFCNHALCCVCWSNLTELNCPQCRTAIFRQYNDIAVDEEEDVVGEDAELVHAREFMFLGENEELVNTREFIVNGKQYLIDDNSNEVYDYDTHELIGTFNKKTGKIIS